MQQSKMSKKNWVIFCCLVLVVMVAVVAVVVVHLGSQPVSGQLTFHGVMVTADGVVLEECDIALAYTKRNHLFEEDYYSDVSLDVAGMHFDSEMHNNDIYPYNLSDQPYEWIMLNCYNAKINAFGDVVKICYDLDWDWCFVSVKIAYEDECQYFVGSVDENVDYEAILEICSDLLD